MQNTETSALQITPERLIAGIQNIQNYFFNQQHPNGYWWADLESNVTMLAEVILLHKIWNTTHRIPLDKAEAFLRREQREHGGWELYYGDGGELSTSVEAYMALRLLGVDRNDEALVNARKFIRDRGGISKTRIFTKLHLALIGCYDWRGLPSIPPWIMLLPGDAPFSIYDMSSWARGSTVPLIIVFDKKPVFPVEPQFDLNELFSEGVENVKYDLPKTGDWGDWFVELDNGFKFAEQLNLVPFREEGLKAAEQWVLERQEPTGDWGGIIPAMLNSMLALRCLEYDVADPVVERGFQAIERFGVETEATYWVQPCVSPVWDTAWVVRALIESGIAPDDERVVKASQWLLNEQILDYGDWAVKNKDGEPGGWAFEFDNRFYPDLDDSAVVVMTLNQAKLPDEKGKQAAIDRCVRWMMSMQCRDGGWAAFDVDNDKDWLNALPYSDLKATIDPPTADVTSRVLEMAGELESHTYDSPLKQHRQRFQQALSYLLREQEADGSWFGRWGVNYIYGTSGALSALALVAPETHREAIDRGASWLISVQNDDGGWGETCRSYDDPALKGQGDSTASQTAWALIGLLAAGEATGAWKREAIDRGIHYLLETQNPDGSWFEAYFTGTGFPSHFYLKYHYYQLYFPLLALGRYRKAFAER
ncbi:squalene--hopene cyclase [Baaleninema sp.]|uniref:squalene--hopene cyclase n=1 Tax=Baaleninema sp. TaxID=3101197 RepID=UPI003D05C8C4